MWGDRTVDTNAVNRLWDHDWKRLIDIFLASLLTIGLVTVATHPYGYSALPTATNETLKQSALDFLEYAAGVNFTGYNVTCDAYGVRLPNSIHFETTVDITLQQDNFTFNFRFVYVESRLWTYDFMDTSSAEPVGEGETLNDGLLAAIHAVEGYQYLSNLTYCDELHSMISTSLQNQRLVVENDDALLNVSYTGGTDLVWYKKIISQYTHPMESLSIHISQNGFLTSFMDNLATHPVATTAINMSEQDALNISMSLIQAYASQHRQQIVSKTDVLGWMEDTQLKHGNDDFAMYPVWYTYATFDKTNEENVDSYQVAIWADNGQIACNQPSRASGALGPRAPDDPNPQLSLIALATVLTFACLAICFKYKRKNQRR
jgi:hypothetical protein